MAKTCIICGNPAGSGEHIFPASFGGRRTNNGIYCEKHNNDFGRHVSALLAGLDIVNASIGVVPDRSDEIRPAPAATVDGEKFLVTAGQIKLAPPPPMTETPDLIGKPQAMTFADEQQARKWIAEQERAGFKVTTGAMSTVQTEVFGETLHAHRSIGSDPFMRGLLYIALTFVAHTNPELARTAGLADTRDIVTDDGDIGDRVFWELPTTKGQVTDNPFQLGHTIVTGPDADGRKVVALISLYGALHFGIEVGEIADGELPERVTTHIDPLALRAPNDISVIRDRGRLVLSSVEQSQQYLAKMRSGQISPLEDVFQRANELELLSASAVALAALGDVPGMPTHQQMDRVRDVLGAHKQRIFNWMRTNFLTFCASTPDLPEAIHVAMRDLVSTSAETPRQLTSQSEAALEVAQALLGNAVLAELRAGTLDEKRLADILGGPAGIQIVLPYFANLIFEARPR